MGGYARELTNDREIEMRDTAASRAHPIYRENKKTVG